MRKVTLVAVALTCLAVAGCNSTATGTAGGAAGGAVVGAVVGGPVGAVVGGGIGAAAGATTGAAAEAQARRVEASPGRCYVYDETGNVAIDRRGRPITTRC
jgi:hypothetical protein